MTVRGLSEAIQGLSGVHSGTEHAWADAGRGSSALCHTLATRSYFFPAEGQTDPE